MASAALWPSSAENILYFGVQKRLRAFRNYFFTGGGVAVNGICSAAFCESAALGRTNPLRLTAFARFPLLSLRDIFPRRGGSLSSQVELFAICRSVLMKLPPRGSWHAVRRD